MDQNPGMHTCTGCGLTRPSTTPYCPKCGRATDGSNAPQPQSTPLQAPPAVDQTDGQWLCTKCSFVHYVKVDICGRCGSDKIVYRTKKDMQNASAIAAFVIIMLLIVVGAPFYSCAGKVVDVASTVNTEDKLQLVSWDWTNDGTYRYIEGIVQNNGTKKANYVGITFKLFDSDHNQVGTTLDSMNYLDPNATWKFKCIVVEDNASSAKLSDIASY